MYALVGDEKGSGMSGERIERSIEEGVSVEVNGRRDRRRTASRMVGWKGPP